MRQAFVWWKKSYNFLGLLFHQCCGNIVEFEGKNGPLSHTQHPNCNITCKEFFPIIALVGWRNCISQFQEGKFISLAVTANQVDNRYLSDHTKTDKSQTCHSALTLKKELTVSCLHRFWGGYAASLWLHGSVSLFLAFSQSSLFRISCLSPLSVQAGGRWPGTCLTPLLCLPRRCPCFSI